MDGEIDLSKNLEINNALKEFEQKSQVEQVQQTNCATSDVAQEVPKMVQLVMKWSGVKDQRQAEYILLGFVIVAIGVSVFLVFLKKNQKAKIEAPTGQKIIYSENAPPRLE